MKNDVQKQKFIELRAEGKSLQCISSAINISKPTLIKWSRELSLEVQNQRSTFIDSIKDDFKKSKIETLNDLKKIILKAESELFFRDFKDLPTDKLLKVYDDLTRRLDDELKVSFRENEPFNFTDPFADNISIYNID